MPNELIKYLPQQWLGIAVLMMFVLYALNKVIEESDRIAQRLGPWARRLHAQAQRKHSKASVATAIEEAMAARQIRESDEFKALNRRLATIVSLNEEQASYITELVMEIRGLAAYARYDTRWHRRADLIIAEQGPECEIPKHMDVFEFQRKFRDDPNGQWRDI